MLPEPRGGSGKEWFGNNQLGGGGGGSHARDYGENLS